MPSRKLIITISIIFFVNNCSVAQSLIYPIALPYVGLSAYSSQQTNAFSFTSNQAALAKNNQAAIGLYTEKHFMQDQISYNTLALALPTPKGNFGLQLNYNGFKNFNETKIGVAYAKNLGSKIDLGIQFNLYYYYIPSYFKATAINAELGAIIHFTDKLNAGFHAYNPVGSKLNIKSNSTLSEKLPTAYKIGFGYDASENFFICNEIIKEEDKPINIIVGVQYHFQKQFFARMGFISQSSIVFISAGVKFKNIQIDIAASYHPLLGISPGVLFETNFGQKISK